MNKLTDLEARNAQPGPKQYRKADGNGLCLTIRPDGGKSWQLRHRFAGKEKTFTIGTFPAVGVKQARAAADEARALLREGTDPTERKRERKHELRIAMARTFGDAAEKWLAHNTPRWKPSNVEKVRQYLDKDMLPPLARRPLDSITPMELGDAVGKIEARGALNVAKKTRQWLSAIFEFAIAKGLTTNNPAEHLAAVAAMAPQTRNHAHLALDELPALLRALDGYPGSPIVKGASWLALWTANRPGVTRTLRWDELDLDGALWTITEGREGMKRGYRHLTPLPRQAVAMLREVHKITGTFEHVFIGRNDPRQPMSDGAVNRMLKAIGFGGKQTAHGFRHLVSTALNERGYEPDWVERQLAHGDPDAIRGVYNKAHYLDERRKMMQAWADYLDGLKAGGNVVPLHRKVA